MQDLKIAMVQSYQHWEDIDANLDMFGEKIQTLDEHADIIVLPEMFSTGFSMNPLTIAEGMDGKSVHWMHSMASHRNAVVTGSIMIKEEGSFYNRLIWMRPDGTHSIYNKRHLFSMAGEEKFIRRELKRL